MIEGIEILNKTEIMVNPGWYDLLLIIVILVGCICFCMLFASLDWAGPVGCIIFGVGLLVSIFAFSCLCAGAYNITEPTGRYKYEAIVDESVSFTELYEQYYIVEHRGEIWVLEDKK